MKTTFAVLAALTLLSQTPVFSGEFENSLSLNARDVDASAFVPEASAPFMSVSDLRKSEDSSLLPSVQASSGYNAEMGEKISKASLARDGFPLKGKCYEYVSYHIENAGLMKNYMVSAGLVSENMSLQAVNEQSWRALLISPKYAPSAYMFAEWAREYPDKLAALKLQKVQTPDSFQSLPVGSIVVYAANHCGFNEAHGHIEVAARSDSGAIVGCSDGCRPVSDDCFSQEGSKEKVSVFMPVY